MTTRLRTRYLTLLLLVSFALPANADPLARPGDMLLRHDIRLLVDEGVINMPMNTWPVPWGEVYDQLNRTTAVNLSPELSQAIARLRDRARWELDPSEWYLTGWKRRRALRSRGPASVSPRAFPPHTPTTRLTVRNSGPTTPMLAWRSATGW